MEIITYNENNHKNTIIMKTKNLLVVAFAGLIALAACKKEPSVTPTADNSINLSASVYGFTKATDTAFEEGDEIGVNVFAGKESWLENALYTYSSTGLTSKTQNAWYDDEELEATLTAYYPYEAGFTGTFSVNADQSTVEKYAASDLLVATAKSLPTEEAINLPFKHALSKVVINVDNQLKEEIENVWFIDVYGEVTFELSDPETLAASGSKGTVKAYKSGENKWQFIIAPQADATPKLALTTTSGNQYTFVLNEAVTFSTGKVSTATVTVSTETIYTSFTAEITDWVEDNELNFSQDNTQVELPEEEEGTEVVPTPDPVDPTPEEPEEPTAKVIYLNPDMWNTADEERFEAYFFEGDKNTWVTMTDENSDNIYECNIPEGYSNVIFCRMDASGDEGDWASKWNQTEDLKLDEQYDTFTITAWDGGKDKASLGKWSKLTK